ncbi:MAG: hypothetical protein LKM38_00430 [Pseudomonas veronii]|jgi:hypothetical protein|nr:hypothetical protein [Pseudomonas veronii]
MDFQSLAIGFLTGAFTGAAGNYLADKYTDTRRRKEEKRETKKFWKDVEARFPKIIQEMKSDLKQDGMSGVRVFFVKESYTMLAFVTEPCFEYNTDKHEDLRAAVHFLLDNNLLKDITPGNAPMYRMSERLVDFLLERKL